MGQLVTLFSILQSLLTDLLTFPPFPTTGSCRESSGAALAIGWGWKGCLWSPSSHPCAAPVCPCCGVSVHLQSKCWMSLVLLLAMLKPCWAGRPGTLQCGAFHMVGAAWLLGLN